MDTVVKPTIFCKLPEPGVGCGCEPTTETRAKPDKKRRKVTPPEPFKVKAKPKAVIRIMMALASPEPATVFKDRRGKDDYFDEFSTFCDIWLAGLSDETFRQIPGEMWNTTKHFWSVRSLLMMHLN